VFSSSAWSIEDFTKLDWWWLVGLLCQSYGVDTASGIIPQQRWIHGRWAAIVWQVCSIFHVYLYYTVKRTEGHGMKLIKIHLLHHFSLMIWLFGCAKIFDTFIPEKITKPKSNNMQDEHVFNWLILNTIQHERIMRM